MSLTSTQRQLFRGPNALLRLLSRDLAKSPLVVCPPFTPFDSAGSVDGDAVSAIASWTAESPAVDAAFVCGTAGEGESLAVSERCAVLDLWAKAAPDLPLIVNCSAGALPDARRLAAYAEAVGAAAVSVCSPAFFAPSSVGDLVAYVKAVASAAPHTPMVYYHFPSRSSCPVRLHAFLEAAASEIPTLIGAKFTDFHVGDLVRSLAVRNRRYFIFAGPASVSLPALQCGAHGAFAYNFLAPLMRVVATGKDAGGKEVDRRRAFEALVRVESALSAHGCTNPTAKRVEAATLGNFNGAPRAPLPDPAEFADAVREEVGQLLGEARAEFEFDTFGLHGA